MGGDGEGASDWGSKVRAELSGSQFPDRQESGGDMTLANTIRVVRKYLLRDGQEHSIQKLWTYGVLLPGPPTVKNFKIMEDGVFKSFPKWQSYPFVKDIL